MYLWWSRGITFFLVKKHKKHLVFNFFFLFIFAQKRYDNTKKKNCPRNVIKQKKARPLAC